MRKKSIEEGLKNLESEKVQLIVLKAQIRISHECSFDSTSDITVRVTSAAYFAPNVCYDLGAVYSFKCARRDIPLYKISSLAFNAHEHLAHFTRFCTCVGAKCKCFKLITHDETIL